MKTYQGHKNQKYSVTGTFGVYSDGEQAFVVSGSEDGSIIIWDVSSKSVLQVLQGHQDVVLGVDTLPDQGLMVTGGLDRTVRIWKAVDEDDLEINGEETS